MASDSIHVRVSGRLQGPYRTANRPGWPLRKCQRIYIRSLISQDLQGHDEVWEWLQEHLEPALKAHEGEFAEVTADDVIRRNLKR